MKLFPATAILVLSIFNSAKIFCQDFKVPENYVFNTKDDYDKYEKDVINCVNWIENTPISQDAETRTRANAFIMKWVTGSPTVSLTLNDKIISKITANNPQLLIFFIGGWTRYSLENNYSRDKVKGTCAGLKCLVNVYKKGIGVNKDKDIDKLVDIIDKDELENWVIKNLR